MTPTREYQRSRTNFADQARNTSAIPTATLAVFYLNDQRSGRGEFAYWSGAVLRTRTREATR